MLSKCRDFSQFGHFPLLLIHECEKHFRVALGWGGKAIKTLQQLIRIYPEEKELWNDLGVRFLLVSRIEDARQAFKKVICQFVPSSCTMNYELPVLF